jgi:excisionase family DNA binding protein
MPSPSSARRPAGPEGPSRSPTPGVPSLSPADLAAQWDVSVLTIRRLLRRKALDYFRVGKAIRIPIASVEKFVAGQLANGR